MDFNINGHNVFLIVIVCFVASAIFVNMMKKIASFLGVMDIPDKKRKIHTKPMPLLGGIGIFLAFLLGYMLFAPKNDLMLSILISSFLIMLLGLFDDMTKCKKPMPNKYKVIVQLVVALIIVFYGGLKITKTSIVGLNINFTFLPFLPELLSVLIIVAIINAMNLIDGLDGLMAGTSSIFFITVIVLNLMIPRLGGSTLLVSSIMLGATLGFLIHNFYPAKIFAGDSGSMFVGMMIAVMSLMGFKTATFTSLLVPICILGIPIIDTICAIIRRIVNKESIFLPDKAHLHHQLLQLGLSHRMTVIAIYIMNILFAVSSILYFTKNKMVGKYFYIAIFLLVVWFLTKTSIIKVKKQKKGRK